MSDKIRLSEWAGIIKLVVRGLLGPGGLSSRDAVLQTMNSCLEQTGLTCAGCGHVFTFPEKKKLMLHEAVAHAGLQVAGRPSCPACGGEEGLVETKQA